jgi:predicted MFS family arabinose efflux permease
MGVLAVWLRRDGYSQPTSERVRIVDTIRVGVGHVVRSSNLRRIELRVLTYGMALGALLALTPLVIRALDATPAGMGLVFAASGGGAVAGALLANHVRAWLGIEPMLRYAIGLTAAGMVAVAIGGSLTVVAIAEVATGFATTLVYASLNILLQLSAPRQLLGRLLSIHQMSAFGGLAAGAWIWGHIADRVGSSTAILAAAAAMVSLIVLSLLTPIADHPRDHVVD